MAEPITTVNVAGTMLLVVAGTLTPALADYRADDRAAHSCLRAMIAPPSQSVSPRGLAVRGDARLASQGQQGRERGLGANSMSMTGGRFGRRGALVAALLGGGFLAGCGGAAPGPAPTPSPALTSGEILAAASKRLAETPTVGFTLDIKGDTFVDSAGTIRLLSASGDLRRPDRVRTEFKAEVLGRAVTLQLITIGDETWITNIIDGSWGPAPAEFAYRPDVLFDTQDGLGPVMGRVTDVSLLPDEKIDGVDAWRLTAQVPQEVIGPLTYNTIQGSPVTVDLWVDKATNDMLRARLSEPPQDGKTPAVWTLDLMRHGKEVEIEPPV